MRIAFDFNPVIKTKFSGFYTFGINLLKAFDEMEEDVDFALFYSRKFTKEAEQMRPVLNNERFKFCPTRVRINHLKKIWKRSSFPSLQLFTGKFDIYHSFHNMMPATKGKPRILTVHDLRRYRLPELYNKPAQEIFERAIKTADHIIAVSESTRNDICEIFGVAENKVSAVPLACDTGLAPLAPEVKAANRTQIFKQLNATESDYLITISATDHRKNISRTIEAFKQVQAKLPQLKLIVAGFLPKNQEELDKINNAAAGDDNIILAGPVDDLNMMIACSEGLLFNSLYEGFGIPIIEAFSFDVPVLTSNCSSMPEVGGDAAIYADPYDVDAIAAGIEQMFGNDREALIERGRKQRERFSWDRSARATLDIYKSLL